MSLAPGQASAQSATDPFDFIPSVHGASAGFTDISLLNGGGDDAMVSSILTSEAIQPGLATYDPRTNLFTFVTIDAFPGIRGNIEGIASVLVTDTDGFTVVSERLVPVRGSIRFRENWRRVYQPGLSVEALGLDGVLRRQIRHNMRINGNVGGPERVRVRLQGNTNFDTDNRFRIAPFGATLRTNVNRSDDANIQGRSEVVITGFDDQAFWWEINNTELVPRDERLRRWDSSTLLFTPFNTTFDEFGNVAILPVGGDVSLRTNYYNLQRDRAGNYNINYRGQFLRDRYRLSQRGALLALAEVEGIALANGNPVPFLNTLWDSNFNASSRQANTRINSSRDDALLKRPN